MLPVGTLSGSQMPSFTAVGGRWVMETENLEKKHRHESFPLGWEGGH